MASRSLIVATTALAVAIPVATAVATGGRAPIGHGGATCVPGPKADCAGVSVRPTTNLRGRNFTGANLSNVDFHDVDLRNANLSKATLTRANLSGTKLDGANLSGAKILGAKITNVSAVGANWEGATIGRAKLLAKRGAGQSSNQTAYANTTFSGNHCGGNFSNASIQGTTFTGDYSQATCGRAATFHNSGVVWSTLSGANLNGVDLSDTGLQGSLFVGTQLLGANLQNAVGAGTNFNGAVFGTNQWGATTNYAGTDLTHSTCPNGKPGQFVNGPCA